jgi:hypothetical protein
MPDLYWRDGKQQRRLLAKTPLRNGENAIMEGIGYGDRLPSTFSVLRTFSPLVRAGLRKIGRETEKDLGDTYPALPLDSIGARSDPVPLQAAGFWHTHRWRFRDNLRNLSPVIRSVRFGAVSVNPSVGAKVAPMELNAQAFQTTIATCLDPSLDLYVVHPWVTVPQVGSVQSFLSPIADHVGEELEIDPSTLHQTLISLLGEYLRESSRGWELYIEPQHVNMGEGDSSTVQLRVRPGEPGGLAFAIAAVDSQDSSRSFFSDVMVAESAPGGEVSILYADDDDETKVEE